MVAGVFNEFHRAASFYQDQPLLTAENIPAANALFARRGPQPDTVFGNIQKVSSGEKLDGVDRSVAERLEQRPPPKGPWPVDLEGTVTAKKRDSFISPCRPRQIPPPGS
jgi:hypothetical protein